MQNNKRYEIIDLKVSEPNESCFLSDRGFRFILYKMWVFLDKRSQSSLLNICKELNRYFHANVSKLNYFLRSLNVKQVSVPAVLPYTESEIGDRQDLIDFNSIEKKATGLLDDRRERH